MTPLQTKVKNALDEARIVVLGTQILVGFQYRAFFEKGFDELPEGARACEIGALFLLLLALALLFMAAARHCLVEGGQDTERFHRFTQGVVWLALLPFAAALSLDVGVAAERVAGRWGGIATGAGVALSSLLLLHGHALHGRRPHAHREEAMHKTPLEQRVVQVLTEAWVVLPGA